MEPSFKMLRREPSGWRGTGIRLPDNLMSLSAAASASLSECNPVPLPFRHPGRIEPFSPMPPILSRSVIRPRHSNRCVFTEPSASSNNAFHTFFSQCHAVATRGLHLHSSCMIRSDRPRVSTDLTSRAISFPCAGAPRTKVQRQRCGSYNSFPTDSASAAFRNAFNIFTRGSARRRAESRCS